MLNFVLEVLVPVWVLCVLIIAVWFAYELRGSGTEPEGPAPVRREEGPEDQDATGRTPGRPPAEDSELSA